MQQREKNGFCMNVSTQLLSKCEEETLAHLRCPQFCFACSLRVGHRESLLVKLLCMHFFVGTASPLALVSKTNSLLGRFLSFFGHFNMDFCDSADKTLGKDR